MTYHTVDSKAPWVAGKECLTSHEEEAQAMLDALSEIKTRFASALHTAVEEVNGRVFFQSAEITPAQLTDATNVLYDVLDDLFSKPEQEAREAVGE